MDPILLYTTLGSFLVSWKSRKMSENYLLEHRQLIFGNKEYYSDRPYRIMYHCRTFISRRKITKSSVVIRNWMYLNLCCCSEYNFFSYPLRTSFNWSFVFSHMYTLGTNWFLTLEINLKTLEIGVLGEKSDKGHKVARNCYELLEIIQKTLKIAIKKLKSEGYIFTDFLDFRSQ